VVFGDSVLKGVIYENNIYKVSQNRFSNICEDILGVPIENKAKFHIAHIEKLLIQDDKNDNLLK